MEFEWDEGKRRENMRKHGIDFIDVPEIFEGPMFTRVDTKHDYGEDSWIGIGYVQNRVLVVCYLERSSAKVIRIISVRKGIKS
ncbi:MAG: BrnT family toxin [Gammaproteobacteria bacterium]|nr:MAG: BrnT family toxin [Gammaproteobacteria bacterium]